MPISLKFLCTAVFILAAVPRLNVTVGPVPIYLIDLCLFGAIYYGGLQRPAILGPIANAGFVIAILVFALLSELLSMIYMGTFVQTVYMSMRMCLAVSIFFLINNLIQDEEDLQHLLKSAVAGGLCTALLMVMTSLPATRGMVSWLFSIDMLSPVGERFFEANAGVERGVRGQSLVGYNIISAWFVALLWPMTIALFRSPWTTGIWRTLALAGSLIYPFGVIFSYSRGAILGLLLIVSALLLFGEGRLKSQIAMAIIVVTSIIGFFGWDSDLFYFERIEKRTRATIENPFESRMESERFGSYIDPFKVIENNPMVTVLGEGLTIDRVRKRGFKVSESPIQFGNESIADHSVFAKGTLKYGMVAALCYIFLLIGSIRRGLSEAHFSQFSEGLTRTFPQLAFASVLGITAWVAFDKGIITQPRGAMMFFLVTGLIGVAYNLRVADFEKEEPLEERPSNRHI